MSSWPRPGLLEALVDGGQELVGVELGALARGADEPVTGTTGIPRHEGPTAGDVDGDRLLGLVVDGGVGGRVVVALEAHPVAGPQLAHEGHRLTQAAEALLELGPLLHLAVRTDRADDDLVERLAGADAEGDPAGVERAEGAEGLRDDGRVVAEGRRHHRGAELHPLGALADSGQPGQRERGVTPVVAPRLEVVADPDAVEAHLLGEHCVVEQPPGGELLRRGLVPDLQRHRSSLPCVRAHPRRRVTTRAPYAGSRLCPRPGRADGRARDSVAAMGSLWHPFSDMAAVEQDGELVIASGDGAYVTDEAGTRYLDATAGLWFTNVGHGRAEIAEAAAAQMRTGRGLQHLRRLHDPADPRAGRAAGGNRPGAREQGLLHQWRLRLDRHRRQAGPALLGRGRASREDGHHRASEGVPRDALRGNGARRHPRQHRGLRRARSRHRDRGVGRRRGPAGDHRAGRCGPGRGVLLRARHRRGWRLPAAAGLPRRRAQAVHRARRALRGRRGHHRVRAHRRRLVRLVEARAGARPGHLRQGAHLRAMRRWARCSSPPGCGSRSSAPRGAPGCGTATPTPATRPRPRSPWPTSTSSSARGCSTRRLRLETTLADRLRPLADLDGVVEVRCGTGALAAVQLADPPTAMALAKRLRSHGVATRAVGAGGIQISPAFVMTDEQVGELAEAIAAALEAA